MQKTRNGLKWFYVGIIALLALVIAGVFFYRNDYRLSGFAVVRAGSIKVTSYQPGSQIYLNDALQKVTSGAQEDVLFPSQTPGTVTVTVAKDGYWPWSKTLLVKDSQETDVAVFLEPQNAGGSIIGPRDPQYWQISAAIAANALPTEARKKTSSDGKVSIWAKDNTIYAQWNGTGAIPSFFCQDDPCMTSTVAVRTFVDPIRTIDFASTRDDVIIFSTASSINALEIDKRGTQNFQPIFTGTDISFSKNDRNVTLYVRDGKQLYEVNY